MQLSVRVRWSDVPKGKWFRFVLHKPYTGMVFHKKYLEYDAYLDSDTDKRPFILVLPAAPFNAIIAALPQEFRKGTLEHDVQLELLKGFKGRMFIRNWKLLKTD